MNSQLSTTPLERRLIWVGREKQELTAFTKPLQSYSVTWHSVGCCSEALSLMSDWPPHLLILDTLEGPTPFTWDTFLGQGLPAVDPYRSGGPWYQEDDTPRVLPVLFLTADIPGPTDLPPAWQHRVHCQPRYHITHLLQAWLEKPLNPPRLQPEPLLIIDFRRHVLWVQGVSLTPPPRTMAVLAVLAKHHPQSLMAIDIVQAMQELMGWRIAESGVRNAIRSLRSDLELAGVEHDLLINRSQGYSFDLGPCFGSLEDRIEFWSGPEAWYRYLPLNTNLKTG